MISIFLHVSGSYVKAPEQNHCLKIPLNFAILCRVIIIFVKRCHFFEVFMLEQFLERISFISIYNKKYELDFVIVYHFLFGIKFIFLLQFW